MSFARSSSAGPIILQGPHHSAQKSTSTGSAALRTSVSKDVSVTDVVLMDEPFNSFTPALTCRYGARSGTLGGAPKRRQLCYARLSRVSDATRVSAPDAS